MLGSRSYFATIGPAAAAPVLAAERAALLGVFPDGIVAEAYALEPTVTLRPGPAPPGPARPGPEAKGREPVSPQPRKPVSP
jgi:hypothetical protein